MPKIHKMVSLDAETYEIAQRMTNFSGHVRKVLKEELVDLEAMSTSRLMAIIFARTQSEFGFDSEEAAMAFKMLQEVKSWGV